MSLRQFFHGHRAFTHDYVARVDGVIGNLALVQGRKQSAFTEHKTGAIGMRLGEEIGGVHRGSVKMLRRKAADAEVFQPHRQILRRWRRVVRQKQKRRAGGQQRGHKLARAGNQSVFPVNHTVHINQVTNFHTCRFGHDRDPCKGTTVTIR
jgi:hypothetical protein